MSEYGTYPSVQSTVQSAPQPSFVPIPQDVPVDFMACVALQILQTGSALIIYDKNSQEIIREIPLLHKTQKFLDFGLKKELTSLGSLIVSPLFKIKSFMSQYPFIWSGISYYSMASLICFIRYQTRISNNRLTNCIIWPIGIIAVAGLFTEGAGYVAAWAEARPRHSQMLCFCAGIGAAIIKDNERRF